MKIASVLPWLAVLIWSGTPNVSSAEAEPTFSPQLLQEAAAVRATDEEKRYLELPWVTDLFQGIRLAEMERRPLFLYVITGDPLGDC